MTTSYINEIYFRPDEYSRSAVTISAKTYNLCRLLYARATAGCFFVPVRCMQYLAVITNHEILFVNSHEYAVKDGKGGRVISLAWQTEHTGQRLSLDEPVPIEVVYYKKGIGAAQLRFMGEFPLAMKAIQQREQVAGEAKVIPISIQHDVS